LQGDDGIRAFHVTGVQTCALPIYAGVLLAQLVQASRDVGHHWPQDFSVTQRFIKGLLEIHRLDLVEVLQGEVVVLQQLAQLDRRSEERRVGKERTSLWSP